MMIDERRITPASYDTSTQASAEPLDSRGYYEAPAIKLVAVKCQHCGGVIYLNPGTGEQDKS